ncbi:MAG: DUF2267 domain-containing protein [Gammaproteobacteria bacterium]|nr:DUF2267 domain-containing protein [Gammaproteobacteria bacterium]
MPVPAQYYHASEQFEKFMLDARDASGFKTTHMAWNMVVGVLQTFRRRISISDALRFSNILPPGIRALFVADWNTEQEILPFSDIDTMTKEVKSVRPAHNFSPENAIESVSIALRRNVDEIELETLLGEFPDGAQQFWSVRKENYIKK